MNKLIFIGGPTATGKSELAIEIAEELGGEIVNADSMQIYRGMDIGTAKLSEAERSGIKHHLIDVVDPSEDVTVSWYQEEARRIIDDVLQSKPVVVVGGTGLYIKAVLDDLNFPQTNVEVRDSLNNLAEKIGPDALHDRLAKLDPAAALAIPKENIRRVVRALEVIEITGKPFTAHLPREGSTRYPDAIQFGLEQERESLDERIEKRVDEMWKKGFIEEVKTLLKSPLGRTAKCAIGYSQIINYLNGECSENDAKDLTKIATRQYARRQETWFQRDERIKWIPAGSDRKELVLRDILKA